MGNVINAKYGIDDLPWWSKKNCILMELAVEIYFAKHFKTLVHLEVKDGSRVLF